MEDVRGDEGSRRDARRHSFPTICRGTPGAPVYHNTPTFFAPTSPTYYNGPVYIYMVPTPTPDQQVSPGSSLPPETLQRSTTTPSLPPTTYFPNPFPFVPATHSPNPTPSHSPSPTPCHTPQRHSSPQPPPVTHIIEHRVSVTQPSVVASPASGPGSVQTVSPFPPNLPSADLRKRPTVNGHRNEQGSKIEQQLDESMREAETTSPHEDVAVKKDPLCMFMQGLFNSTPHYLFHKYYHHRFRELVRLFFVLFMLYQGLASLLITICEDGGVQAVFQCKEGVLKEVVHRLLIFSLRIMCRVVTPLCCVFQLPKIAAKPRIPHTSGLTKEAAVERMIKVHETFSSDDEVMEIRNNHSKIYEVSERTLKRRIQLWMTVLHALFFTILLLYLGAFFVVEQKIMKGGVCNFVDSTIITLFGARIHFIVVFECISIFVIVLLMGIVKDCYSYENRIAAIAAIIGGNAKKVQEEIRRRWAILDEYCYVMPLVMTLFTVFSLVTGKAFTPRPPQNLLKAHELATWYFWITILSVLKFLGSSPNRMVRWAGLMSYGIAVIFIYVLQSSRETIHIPPGSIFILVFVSLAVNLFNLLVSLARAHYYRVYAQETTTGVIGHYLLFFCQFCICLLPVCVAVMIYREVVYYADFVEWT